MPAVQSWPTVTSPGGCSLILRESAKKPLGSIYVTEGRLPEPMSAATVSKWTTFEDITRLSTMCGSCKGVVVSRSFVIP